MRQILRVIYEQSRRVGAGEIFEVNRRDSVEMEEHEMEAASAVRGQTRDRLLHRPLRRFLVIFERISYYYTDHSIE
jgi:hypothetical protein